MLQERDLALALVASCTSKDKKHGARKNRPRRKDRPRRCSKIWRPRSDRAESKEVDEADDHADRDGGIAEVDSTDDREPIREDEGYELGMSDSEEATEACKLRKAEQKKEENRLSVVSRDSTDVPNDESPSKVDSTDDREPIREDEGYELGMSDSEEATEAERACLANMELACVDGLRHEAAKDLAFRTATRFFENFNKGVLLEIFLHFRSCTELSITRRQLDEAREAHELSQLTVARLETQVSALSSQVLGDDQRQKVEQKVEQKPPLRWQRRSKEKNKIAKLLYFEAHKGPRGRSPVRTGRIKRGNSFKAPEHPRSPAFTRRSVIDRGTVGQKNLEHPAAKESQKNSLIEEIRALVEINKFPTTEFNKILEEGCSQEDLEELREDLRRFAQDKGIRL